MDHGWEYISIYILSFSVKILGIATLFLVNSSGFPPTALTVFTVRH